MALLGAARVGAGPRDETHPAAPPPPTAIREQDVMMPESNVGRGEWATVRTF